ncbi:MAG: YggT family protein [Firmicutes bacterium]|nr:YggT family protein [Bacillota bacterium]
MITGIIRLALYWFWRLLDLAILVYCIMSWIVTPGSRLYRFYYKLGCYLEPLFVPVRKLLGRLRLSLPIDLAPWITMILLGFVYRILISIIR